MRTGRHVIIGASAAGVSAAMASRRVGFTGEVVVVGAERHPPYERPPLSKKVIDVDDVESALSPIVPEEQLRSNQVELRLGLRIQAIDPSAGTVLLDDGEALPADSVLLATGASPRRLRIPGSDLEGICYLRTADDARELGRRLRSQAPVVVVGAGFIGLEVAAVARQLGRDVTVVESLRQPLLRAGGPLLGSVFAAVHREHGVRLLLDSGVTAFRGAGGVVEAVELAEGRTIPAATVVVGIGVRPETGLAATAGVVVVDDGVIVDQHGRTSLPWLFAAGDVASRPHVHCPAPRVRIEHWNNALYQGAAVGRTMAGQPSTDDSVPYFWSDQYDVKLQMFGRPESTDAVVTRGDPASRSATFLWLRDGRPVAVASMNRPREARAARGLIEKRAIVEPRLLADESVDLRRLLVTG
ncbi:MAG TPA: FAD-dependent oxidoreductase [Actinomycetes bacterium]|jgi:3-phenylpropionate/trans-cinnamate dioxygenase ferredoxin reductase subunit|nr:FAD-dependent oxidoreductase [Actinomycetes bacterium]